jgi:ribulose-phosphate 3-epimerase
VHIRISPSVLNADLANLTGEVARIATTADSVHLDVMDGHFVPNLTFGAPVVASVLAQTQLPGDCHLMIDDPDRWAPEYAEVGSASVTFHIEAASNPAAICRDLHRLGAQAGVAVKPGTPLEALEPAMGELDMILVMTVEPGFGGQSFLDDMLPKVRAARAMAGRHGPDIAVQVDGGITAENIALAAQAGATSFVAGSAVFRASDPAAMVQRLRSLAEQGASQ